jgi:ecotin
MKVVKGLLVSACLLLVPAVAAGDMNPYPAPEDGFERKVFRLPVAGDEGARKVEIIVGKTLSVDCNRTAFGGVLERRVATGWGYPYLVLPNVSGPMSTRMACPPGKEDSEQFITVNGEGFLQRYNSKLPVVVYVPQGFDVRYRIWAAQEEMGVAESE